jgi:hypothetical protein
MTSQGGAGGHGFAATPLSGTPCLIVSFGAEESYILSTFRVSGTNDVSPSWGAPGDLSHRTDAGGHLLFTQSGLFDLMSNPWCRLSMIPDTGTIRATVRNLEIHQSPFSAIRCIQDEGEERQFFELFLNSRFLYRDGDTSPDVQITFGDATTSPKAHAQNARSEWLGRMYFETRSLASGSTVRKESESLWGGVSGVGRVERVKNVPENTQSLQETGHFSGGEDGAILQRTTHTLSNGSVVVQVEDSGRVTITSPTWRMSADAEGRLEIKNKDTDLVIQGKDIYVGGESDAEPLALGQKLLDRIESIETFLNTHTHTHPQGPTTGVIGRAPAQPDFLSDRNNVN